MHRLIFVFALVIMFSGLSAQVTVKEDLAVETVMNKYKNIHAETNVVKAWRIQIITTDDRREMDLANQKFKLLYPHIWHNWEHNAPYYQVKVGAYQKREDLEAFLLEIKQEFPSAIPVLDDIEKSELVKSNGL